MDKFKEGFTIKNCCIVLNLSRSVYYANQNRETIEQKYSHLKPLLENIIKDNSSYGYRRVQDSLKNDYHLVINHKPLQKLLKLWNLGLKRNLKKKKPSGIGAILKEMGSRANLLKSIAEEEAEPLKIFQTDFSQISAECGSVYLFPYLDFKTKIVTGFYISLTHNTQDALKAYRDFKAFMKDKKISLKDCLVHQDQGSVYTSYEYVSALTKDDIIPSYSRPGKPGDNPGMESFFGRLKVENKNLFASAKNLDELKKFVEQSIWYYNYQRIHSKTNGLSPMDNLKTAFSL